MVIQSTLAPGEDYPSADELLATDDLKETVLRVWGKPIRVRGLGLLTREEIRASCWRSDGQRDTPAMVRRYLGEGITTPRMNETQLDRFIRKHAGDVEAIYLWIDRLTELSYELVVAEAQALAGLAPGEEQDQGEG